jgi:hypothetical protein
MADRHFVRIHLLLITSTFVDGLVVVVVTTVLSTIFTGDAECTSQMFS